MLVYGDRRVVDSLVGGDWERGKLAFRGYSLCPMHRQSAYLEPNRNTLQYPKRGRSLLAFSAVISMLKNSPMQRQPKYASWLLYMRGL